MKKVFLFTCEHGGNQIPSEYKALFKGNEAVLETHRGWDIGALEVARALSGKLNIPLFFSTTSRLLVELNRSLHHASLFSVYTKAAPEGSREEILKEFYHPYREKVTNFIANALRDHKEVVHISIHSFTPELNGEIRNADFGLLYDPSSPSEKEFCVHWQKKLAVESSFRVRLNYPYKGTADGFTTHLRKIFRENYSGIELEINQGLLSDDKSTEQVIEVLVRSLIPFLK